MKPRPKPLLGLVLGLLFGVVVVGLLWQLGVAPPDRFILFGILAVAIVLTELLLTQTLKRGKKRFTTVMIIAGVFGGVALTGIPETFMGKGVLADGCTIAVESSMDSGTATDTSAFAPFDVTPTETVEWTSSTDQVLTNWDASLGLLIGGIPAPMWSADRDNAEGLSEWQGTLDVATLLAEVEDDTGLELRGTYHAYGTVLADEGECRIAGYTRVNAEGPFATPLIIGLWAAGAVLAIMIVWIGVSVGRSVRDAKNAVSSDAATVREEPEVATPPAEPIGAFTEPAKVEEPEPVAETRVMPVAETETLPVAQETPPPPQADMVAPLEPEGDPGPPSSNEDPKAP